MKITIKRVYDPVSPGDGTRILVDRLWPRGVSKEKAKINIWLKEIAPSNELRKWFHHDVGKWEDFKVKYLQELVVYPELIEKIKNEASKHAITLVFAASDKDHNNAVVLKEYLLQ